MRQNNQPSVLFLPEDFLLQDAVNLAKSLNCEIYSDQGKLYLLTANSTKIELRTIGLHTIPEVKNEKTDGEER